MRLSHPFFTSARKICQLLVTWLFSFPFRNSIVNTFPHCLLNMEREKKRAFWRRDFRSSNVSHAIVHFFLKVFWSYWLNHYSSNGEHDRNFYFTVAHKNYVACVKARIFTLTKFSESVTSIFTGWRIIHWSPWLLIIKLFLF